MKKAKKQQPALEDGDRRKQKQPLILDPRFSKLQTDPKFQKLPRGKKKLPVDARFRSMLVDKKFSDPVALDKRGRPLKNKERWTLQRYYRIEDDEAEAQQTNAEPQQTNAEPQIDEHAQQTNVEPQIDEHSKILGKKVSHIDVHVKNGVGIKEEDFVDVPKRVDAGRIEENSEDSNALFESHKSLSKKRLLKVVPKNSESGQPSEDFEGSESEPENDSDSSSSSSSSSSDSEESQVEEEEEEEEEKVATTSEETRRLALVNMDWQHIKAVDLLVLMKSFLPKGGQIQTVTIYPSQFGLQQMKEEDIHGPKRIFESDGSDEEGDRIDMDKLRQYEKDKLRYYFAIVVCDTKATASFLYNTCDGTEFERTSNILDMRFVPDGMEFQTQPHDSASEVPDGYRAPEYETKALQLSNVKLTWEEDEPVRVKALRRKFNADELNEMDFATYLASDDDVDSENDRKDEEKKDKREKYRQLLLGSGDVNPENARDDVDMEVTFPSGLSDLNKRLLEQKEKREHKDETVWEAYLRKKKEKKKSRMKEKDSESDNESDVSADIAGNIKMSDSFLEQDDDAFNDPFFKDGDDPEGNASKGEGKIGHQAKKNDSEKTKESHNAKKEEEKRRKQEEQQSKAELELLLMDDHALENGVKGFNLKSKGPKGKKKKKQNESLSNGISKKEELVLSTDYDDPRFSALYTNHHFAIDPTDPQFRRYASQLRPIVERQQQKLQEIDQSKSTSHERDDVGARKKKLELSSLVRSLKRKSMPHMLGNIV